MVARVEAAGSGRGRRRGLTGEMIDRAALEAAASLVAEGARPVPAAVARRVGVAHPKTVERHIRGLIAAGRWPYGVESRPGWGKRLPVPPLDAERAAWAAELYPLARRVAERIRRRRAARPLGDEVESEAMRLLVLAAATWTPDRGPFRRYAARRLEWAGLMAYRRFKPLGYRDAPGADLPATLSLNQADDTSTDRRIGGPTVAVPPTQTEPIMYVIEFIYYQGVGYLTGACFTVPGKPPRLSNDPATARKLSNRADAELIVEELQQDTSLAATIIRVVEWSPENPEPPVRKNGSRNGRGDNHVLENP